MRLSRNSLDRHESLQRRLRLVPDRESLMLVSGSGPTMMARIGIMKALNRHVEREFNPERKDTQRDR